MVLNVKYASESCWYEVCKKVDKAVVFVDELSAEALHWHGGAIRLHQSGALGVRDFSSFESGGDFTKAVFIVSSPLVGPSRIILRDLISCSKFQHCILIMSCSPVVLNLATAGNVPENSHEMTALHKLEHDMLRWMRNKAFTAEIFHFPISVVPITDFFFVMPPFRNMFPCFTEDLEGKTIYTTLPRNLDLEALPLELQVGVLHLMTSINSLLSQLSIKENIYCMGILSSLVGSQLQKHPPSAIRVKTATNNASLVLIDRTVDLCDIMFPSKDVILDIMKAVLPPFPGHCIDVAIDMGPVCYSKFGHQENYLALAPGCLHDPLTDLMHWFIYKKPSLTVTEVYKRISAACEIKNFPKGVTIDQLSELTIENFEKDYDKIGKHSGLVQATLGLVEAFKSKKLQSLEVAEGVRKLIYQSISANNGTDEILLEFKELIVKRKTKGLNVELILSILIFFYSLIGVQFDVNKDIEIEVKEALADALEEDKTEIGSLETALDSFERKEVDTFCDQIFRKLNYVKNTRSQFSKYRDVASFNGLSMPLQYNSIISQLICDIVDVTKPEIPDLRYKANISLRDNFTSRFSSMLLNTSKPHVMDNDVILIFVIGGITAQEVKFIKDCFKAYNKEVLIGSTSLVSPAQVAYNLFVTDPLKPFDI